MSRTRGQAALDDLKSSVVVATKHIGIEVTLNDDGGDRDAKRSWHATADTAWQDPQVLGTAELAQ